ncbi:MAG: hypothetical protein U9N87_07420 [Planctomycetota bacterium]|nr:hypothetical protein [Planctomycetota bacterium]
MQESVEAHATAANQDVAHLKTLSPHERGVMIELACEAAAAINRSRLAAGLPIVESAPWPQSTWDFLRKNAANART